MLTITRTANHDVAFTLGGGMDSENVPELKTLSSSQAKGRRIVLDREDLTLVDQDAVDFLGCREAESIQLESCPFYIRECIDAGRDESNRHKR
jgi:anti-anti-sigma regulatory factor